MADQQDNPQDARQGELFRLLLENVLDYAIFVIDPEGHVESWNPGAERLLGYREDEIVGRPAATFFTPEDVEKGFPKREMEQAIKEGRSSDDRWHVRKDGSHFWCGGTMTALWDEEKKLRGFAKIMRDRTEWKQAEDERASRTRETERLQRLYDAALSNTPDLVYVFDLDHRFIYVNPGLLKVWGRTWDEAVGKTCLELGYEPWHATMHDREIEQVVATKQPIRGEVPFTGTFGRRIYEYIFVPVLGENGEVEAVAGTTRDVTDRREAEERVRHSERFHRAIAELSTDYAFDGTISSDGAVRIERVSEGFAKFYGLSMDEMNARGGWSSVIHPDDHPVVGKTIERLLGGQTDRGEVRGLFSDGSVKWQSYLTVPIRDAQNGRTVGLYGAATDVTAQRRLTEEVRERAESLSAILTATVDHIYLIDKAGRYRYASLGGARVLGLKPEQMAGKRWQELGLPADVMERFDAQRERAVATGTPQRHEVDFRDQAGGSHHYEYTIAPVRGADGGFDAVVVVSRDETERKRAEEALREAERRWRDLAEALPNLVWTDLPDGQCDYLSSQWGAYTGIPERELLGLTWLERVVHPDDRERTLACWTAAVADKGVYDLEYRIRRHDGQYRWFQTRGVPIRDGAGRIVKWFGTCTDIEEQKRSVEALRDADRRKDEFLATLAHELRNPLAPIRNALQILKMPRVDAATIGRSREMMERQVHHLVRLVDDLLDVSRVMRGKIELRREAVELATVVARAVETVQPLIQSQAHTLEISIADESLLLDADPVRLAQVVGNLLTNSAKYTEAKGRIWLTARREGGEAVLSVRDNGIGIAPDTLPHVFELFVQADHATTKAQGGLGIGLTLVKNLVALHGGTVEAHSPGLGQGCEFIARLPLSTRTLPERRHADPGHRVQSALPTGHRLLVVDDNQDAAVSLAMLLRLQGHEVRVAHSGGEALEMTRAYVPDAVFLDIGMPGMDGYEVARRLRQQPGLEKVVLAALTGWGQQEDRRRTAEAGFDHHLVKPPEPEALERVLAPLPRPTSEFKEAP